MSWAFSGPNRRPGKRGPSAWPARTAALGRRGVLFLDEFGELGTDEQAMLLKAVEEKTFYPVGSDREVSSDFQLGRAAIEQGHAVRFNLEAKHRHLGFAQSAEALWSGNFRDLSASATRLATLAEGGWITTALVDAEIARLRLSWQRFGLDWEAVSGGA